jgi:hypothetical protein
MQPLPRTARRALWGPVSEHVPNLGRTFEHDHRRTAHFNKFQHLSTMSICTTFEHLR